MRGSRWLQGECKDRRGRVILRKASFSLARLISWGALSLGQSLEAVSEQGIYLVTPVTFRRSLFPSSLKGQPTEMRWLGWSWLLWQALTDTQDFNKERRLHRGPSGEREDKQLAFSDANVLYWGKQMCTCDSFISSIPLMKWGSKSSP